MRVFKTFLVALSTTLLTIAPVLPAHAWGRFGHKAVAYTAWTNLDQESQDRCIQLLKLNPRYRHWKREAGKWPFIPEEPQIFMQAAVWSDDIKGIRDYYDGKHLYKMDGYKPSESDAANLNIGYSDLNQHRYWHFVDIPYSIDGTEVSQPEEPTAKTEIDLFRKTLGSATASDDVKSYDLCWLLHLVGDVHQPLHCVTRIDKNSREGDRGGNKVELYGYPENLHSFWDGIAGADNAGPDEIIFYTKEQREKGPSDSKDLSTDNWIQESFRLAKESVYKDPVGQGFGKFVLNDTYKSNAAELAWKQIRLAGERLAQVIKQELR